MRHYGYPHQRPCQHCQQKEEGAMICWNRLKRRTISESRNGRQDSGIYYTWDGCTPSSRLAAAFADSVLHQQKDSATDPHEDNDGYNGKVDEIGTTTPLRFDQRILRGVHVGRFRGGLRFLRHVNMTNK